MSKAVFASIVMMVFASSCSQDETRGFVESPYCEHAKCVFESESTYGGTSSRMYNVGYGTVNVQAVSGNYTNVSYEQGVQDSLICSRGAEELANATRKKAWYEQFDQPKPGEVAIELSELISEVTGQQFDASLLQKLGNKVDCDMGPSNSEVYRFKTQRGLFALTIGLGIFEEQRNARRWRLEVAKQK
jgi:hypothetical protein